MVRFGDYCGWIEEVRLENFFFVLKYGKNLDWVRVLYVYILGRMVREI